MVEPTSLLGLEGLGVRSVVRLPDRTRVVEVVTTDPNASRCPDCGIASTSVKGHAVTTHAISATGMIQSYCGGTRLATAAATETCERTSFTEALTESTGEAAHRDSAAYTDRPRDRGCGPFGGRGR